MKNNDIDCEVYPGGHVPLIKEEVIAAFRKAHKIIRLSAPVITEVADAYKVELAVPGIRKENFLVYSDKNTLTICALKKDGMPHKSGGLQMTELNYDCFVRRIKLPADADTDFVNAQYNSGIMQIYVSKSPHPTTSHTRIVVY